MAKHNIVIIGAGLFGSVAASLARAEGHMVTLVDGAHPWAASKASGCVLAPSWLSSLDKEAIAAGTDVLKALYTLHDMSFKTNMLATFKAQRVVTSEVLLQPDIVGEVVAVKDGTVTMEGGEKLKGKVLVAAGIACHKLLPQIPAIKALWGSSLLVPGRLEADRIHVYAPYRQAVAFNMDKKRVWMGDGTALVTGTWEKKSAEYQAATRRRAADLFGLPERGGSLISGARPYVEGHKAGFFEKVMPNTWVSTGGAKNGTMLAAWQAHKFLKELR